MAHTYSNSAHATCALPSSNVPPYHFALGSPPPATVNSGDSGAADPPLPGAATPSASPIAPTTAVVFVAEHTEPSTSHSVTDECPICLDAYTIEDCLQIIGITGCNHHIGGSCLREMLERQPGEEKRCPLCRTVWIPGALPTIPPRIRSLLFSRTPNTFRTMNGNRPVTIAGGQGQAENALNLDNVSVPRRVPPQRFNPRAVIGPRSMLEELRGPRLDDLITNLSSSTESGREEEDYAAEVQSFTSFAQDIAEIRRRAENTPCHRRGSRRRSRPQHIHVGNHSDSSTDDKRVEPRTRPDSAGTPGTSAFNRFMNTRALNPFRLATNETAPSAAAMGDYLHSTDTRGVVRAQRQPSARVIQHRGTSGHGTTETSPRQNSIPLSFATDSHTPAPIPGLGVDVEMTAARTDNQLPSTLPSTMDWSDPVHTRQRYLDDREQSLDARQINLMRREALLLERERRVENLLEVVKRQREEVEEMMRRQREELTRISE